MASLKASSSSFGSDHERDHWKPLFLLLRQPFLPHKLLNIVTAFLKIQNNANKKFKMAPLSERLSFSASNWFTYVEYYNLGLAG